jgi:hypothetical protein
MSYFKNRVNEIKDWSELQDIYAQVFNFENKLSQDDKMIKNNCRALKKEVVNKLDLILK